jgi:hypothetical protein
LLSAFARFFLTRAACCFRALFSHARSVLQPNSDLHFEVELLKIGDESASAGGCITQ